MGCHLTRTKVSDLQDCVCVCVYVEEGGGGVMTSFVTCAHAQTHACTQSYAHALDGGQALKGFWLCEKVFWICPPCCVCCHDATRA